MIDPQNNPEMESKEALAARLESEDRRDGITRRQFLQGLSASFAGMAVAACGKAEAPEKIIPYLDQPATTAPGLSRYYATTCGGCQSACGALAKSREGRPIKMEGNPDHPISQGGLCGRGQATIMDLYDSSRLKEPLLEGSPVSWDKVDSEIRRQLDSISKKGGHVVVVTRTISSPSIHAAGKALKSRYGAVRHVVYDPASASSILEAHEKTHGLRALPSYHFDKARVLASFGADFLGTWLSPVEFSRDWAAARDPQKMRSRMSYFVQLESRMSPTGANADRRVRLKPSEEIATLAQLGRLLAKRLGWAEIPPRLGNTSVPVRELAALARKLAAARGESLVVSGSKSVGAQVLVNWINQRLGNYGKTLDLSKPSYQYAGDDRAMAELQEDLRAGKIDALLFLDSNPAYDSANAAGLRQILESDRRPRLMVSLADRLDETAALCGYALPLSHALESWGDARPAWGVASLLQPLLRPLYNSRSIIETLLAWGGSSASAHDFVRGVWKTEIYPTQKSCPATSFDAFWNKAVERGVVSFQEPAAAPKGLGFNAAALAAVRPAPGVAGSLELDAFVSVPLFDGRQANNPWLQEMPDPVTKVTWGNTASFSPADAARLGVEEGRIVRLSGANGAVAELPAHIQPGQADGVVAAALGHGRKAAGPVAFNEPRRRLFPIEEDAILDADLYPLRGSAGISVQKLERTVVLAKIQTYDYQEDPILGYNRNIVHETTLNDYLKDPAAGNPEVESESELWPKHKYPGRKWAMAIDLNSCTGCSACMVACRAENNIPVVGKAEVRKKRDLYWIRIDRYYSGSPQKQEENPRVSQEPMLCQQCDNAPCETVCPVAATSHSSEGLNMQVYNRCVGTRFCENNCPYKVRRFNWFDYEHNDLIQNLALNPDVTVRTRGVMEKCTFCVQRINSAEITAKTEGREVKDGDVTSACQQSCPTQAIVFGDINDPKSRIAKLAKNPRAFRVLADLGTGPSVFYQTKVRNEAA